jgi:hypothetical protein
LIVQWSFSIINPKTPKFSIILRRTKHLIEDYTEEVVHQLDYLASSNIDGFGDQAKIDFFSDTRQGFGNTALLLHGGATFGTVYVLFYFHQFSFKLHEH